MDIEVKTHKDLNVYKLSIQFVTKVYKITAKYPKDELFGLVSQIRRAAVAIPSNIAEGSARQSKKEFLYFLYIALGSAAELDTQLLISSEIGFITKDEYTTLQNDLTMISKMLNKLIQSLKNNQNVKKPITNH